MKVLIFSLRDTNKNPPVKTNTDISTTTIQGLVDEPVFGRFGFLTVVVTRGNTVLDVTVETIVVGRLVVELVVVDSVVVGVTVVVFFFLLTTFTSKLFPDFPENPTDAFHPF